MEVTRILVVDDDTDDREIIVDALKMVNADVQIDFADNGEEALKILSQPLIPETTPCLIVLDLNMPKMNGAHTLQLLKNDHRLKNIPTVMYSTSINSLEKEKCLILGAHSYITKPISFKESLETAKLFLSLCESQLLHNTRF